MSRSSFPGHLIRYGAPGCVAQQVARDVDSMQAMQIKNRSVQCGYQEKMKYSPAREIVHRLVVHEQLRGVMRERTTIVAGLSLQQPRQQLETAE